MNSCRQGLGYGAAARPFGVLVALLLGACAHHVRLQAPGTAPGARYSCAVGAPCQPATTDVPSELNRRGTSFLVLPEQCGGQIHQIVILDADSSEPKVDVTCAPHEEPIELMQ